MKRLHLTALIAGAAILAACASSEHPPPEPIYRHINVARGDEIRLGERFRRDDLAKQLNDSTFVLKAGTFAGGGTRTIRLSVDARRTVRAMTFVYDGSEPLDQKVRDYSRSLGAPVASSAGAVAGGRRYTWQDRETRFELIWEPDSVPGFWSRLTDLRAAP